MARPKGPKPVLSAHRLEHPDIAVTGNALAPDLTGYASQDWLREMILDPSQDKYCGSQKQSMPKVAERLTSQEVGLLVDWVLGEETPGS